MNKLLGSVTMDANPEGVNQYSGGHVGAKAKANKEKAKGYAKGHAAKAKELHATGKHKEARAHEKQAAYWHQASGGTGTYGE